jgi:FMN phosphatase YigB (HAD superfamily)
MIGDNVVADVLGAEALGIPAVLVRRPDSRAARYADTLAGVDEFLSEAVAA